MKGAWILFTILAVAFASDALRSQFDQFKATYGKSYSTQHENEHRFAIFKQSLARAAQSEADNHGSARFGVTQFSDLTPQEFRRSHLMPPSIFKANRTKVYADGPVPQSRASLSCSPDSTSYDWNSCGCVGGVRNQGQCGSCWAFSTAETVESYCALAGQALQPLSVEQIVDCDTTDDGCGGGLPSNAYGYIQQAGGLETEAEYPYTAGSGNSGTCQFVESEAICTVTGYQSISGESGLYAQTSSSSGGPVSVCLAAGTFQDYTGGVLTSCPTTIDHCVQLTGYNNYGGSGAYWIVRNSWGTSWGENGYIWIAIGSDLCSIGDEATVPSVSIIGGSTSTSDSDSGNDSASSSSGGDGDSSSSSSGSDNDMIMEDSDTRSTNSVAFLPFIIGGSAFVVILAAVGVAYARAQEKSKSHQYQPLATL